MDVKSLLSKLILGEITVSQALMLTKSFYSSSVSENSLKWINRECDGYESALLIPDYRLLDCTLSIEIYDVFGNLQEFPLDTSHIVSYLEAGGHGKSAPNKMRITQNIESLEQGNNNNLDIVNMYLDDSLKKELLKWYLFPEGTRFGKLIQKTHAEYINGIVSKVKVKLIDILQTEVLTIMETTSAKLQSLPPNRKKIFISYSWEDDAHNKWVHELADKLRKNFDVEIDEKIPLGMDINVFMESKVSNSDRVLMILTPIYKQKADSRISGVGYESVLMSEELYKNQDSIKFVPIIRKGTKESSFPKYIGDRKGLCMVNDSDFETKFNALVKDLMAN